MRALTIIVATALFIWDMDAIRVGAPIYLVSFFLAGHMADVLTTGSLAARARRIYE